jgi:anti-sigma regulatory factor (Ser/Thr protein kinase)
VHHRFRCHADPSSPRRVRREVSDVLEGIDAETLATAQLLVSELATNVVLHGGDHMAVDVDREPERVRIEVSDDGEGMPARRHPTTESDGGRGLGMVELASSAWGVQPRVAGKTVWFELALAARQPGPLRA